MTNQYQEHQDFESGRASELQNCLSEAEQYARSQSTVEGEGPYSVIVEQNYYCASTDAIAGSIITEARFMEIDEAIDAANALLKHQSDEVHVSLSGPGL